MDKLTLAHSYMVEYVKSNGLEVTDLEVRCAFDIAEAMLAENEKRTDKTRPAVLDEFQVDWSQAPEWAKWWAMDGFSNKANWYKTEPFLDDDAEDSDEWNIVLNNSCAYKEAPSFDYQGNWRDSLRERK